MLLRLPYIKNITVYPKDDHLFQQNPSTKKDPNKNQIGSSKNYLSKEEISRWDFGASTVMKLIEAFFTQIRCRLSMMMMVIRKQRWRKVIARVRSIFIICVANHSFSVHNNQPVPVNKMKLMDICAVNRVWKMLWMINWWGLISRWKFLNFLQQIAVPRIVNATHT